MPRELIYTSAPRGLTPSQSGYCTVGRSRDLREALLPRLEKLSYYSQGSGVVCTYRIIDLRGVRFHTLSRIVDAGLDFTRRSRFLAHHLIFDPSELGILPSPARLFLEWNGWRETWDGDPEWLNTPEVSLAGGGPKKNVAKSIWISGAPPERETFLKTLAELRIGWECTFTTCFQPGDRPSDFQIKAAWPDSPGFEEAQRLGADFRSPAELRSISFEQPETKQAPAEPPPAETTPLPSPVRQRGLRLVWVALLAVLLIAALAAAVFYRKQPPQAGRHLPAPKPVEPITNRELARVFGDQTTWLTVLSENGDGEFAPAPQLERIFKDLRDAELFAKDLRALAQMNLHSEAVEANLDSRPDEKLLRFSVANEFKADLLEPNRLRSPANEPFAVEISIKGDKPVRIMAIPAGTPVRLPARLVKVTPEEMVTLDPDAESRLRRVELKEGEQLALRPLFRGANGVTSDPLAKLETDFSILPALNLDWLALHAHLRHILDEKEKSITAMKAEHAELNAAEKKLMTGARTAEEQKRKQRFAALDLAIPKAVRELETLRKKAGSIPASIRGAEHFSIFLCQSNLNTEIIRLIDAP